MRIFFKHPLTGEIKDVRQGFNFVFFFFGPFMGIPLYAAGLESLGTRFVLYNIFMIMNMFGLIPFVKTNDMQLLFHILINLAGFILAMYVGIAGNSRIMDKYYRDGFQNYVPDEIQRTTYTKQQATTKKSLDPGTHAFVIIVATLAVIAILTFLLLPVISRNH